MRRTWMLLLVVAMLAVFMAVPALAAEGDTTRTYCVCGATKDLENGPKAVDAVEHEAWCTKVNLEWKPLTDASVSKAGNYYVPDAGLTLAGGRNLGTDSGTAASLVINIDLNGAEVTRASSRLYTVKGCQLNFYDTEGDGRMVGHGGVNTGGVLWMASKAKEVNIYGGTFVQEGQMSVTEKQTSSCGGVIAVNYGTLKLYGGTIEGNENYTTTTGAQELPIQGQAIYSSKSFYLNGGSVVGEIYVSGGSVLAHFGQSFDNAQNALKITLTDTEREFTNKLSNLAAAEAVAGMIEGNGFEVAVSNSNKMYAYTEDYGASVAGEDLVYGLGKAIEKADGQKLVTVLADYVGSFGVTKDAMVDLNGKTVSGDCTISAGKTLHLVDSQNLYYTSEDGGALTGKVVLEEGAKIARETFTNGMLEDEDKNYRFVTIAEPAAEEGGNPVYSAHRIWLGVTSTKLYPGAKPVVGYKISLRCDDKVAQYVKDYGLYVPGTSGTACYRTDAVAATYDENDKVIGFRYSAPDADLAQTQILANAYVIFNDALAGGETEGAKAVLDACVTNTDGVITNSSANVVLGPTAKPTLKAVVEALAAAADFADLTDLHEDVTAMYTAWKDVMDSWAIDAIKGLAN